MKTASLLFCTLLSVVFVISSCKSTTDEYNDANPDVAQKYIKRLEIVPDNEEDFEETVIIVNYDAKDRVSSIIADYSSGSSTKFFNYSDANNLSSITSSDGNMDIDEILQVPCDVFDIGYPIEYDNNANPIKIEAYERGYGSEILVGDIIYDPNPNPFFYTLKAAGIIDCLDIYDLNFGYPNHSLTKARLLLPLNNIRALIFKDMSGITKKELQIEYVYDVDDYPISAAFNVMYEDESITFKMYYYYR